MGMSDERELSWWDEVQVWLFLASGFFFLCGVVCACGQAFTRAEGLALFFGGSLALILFFWRETFNTTPKQDRFVAAALPLCLGAAGYGLLVGIAKTIMHREGLFLVVPLMIGGPIALRMRAQGKRSSSD